MADSPADLLKIWMQAVNDGDLEALVDLDRPHPILDHHASQIPRMF